MNKREIRAFLREHSEEIKADQTQLSPEDIPEEPDWLKTERANHRPRVSRRTRRLMYVCVPLLAVVIFLCTPFGQTCATSFYNAVVQWGSGNSSFKLNQIPDDLVDGEPFIVQSLQSIRDKYGCKVAENERFELGTCSVMKDTPNILVTSEYEQDGQKYAVSEKVALVEGSVGNTGTTTSAGGETFEAWIGYGAYPAMVVMEEDQALAWAVTENSAITVRAEGVTKDQVKAFLEAIVVK